MPAGATGAIVTLTVTNTGSGVGGAGGFVKLYSGALTTAPSISTINWFGPGQNLATTTQVAVDATGHVNVLRGREHDRRRHRRHRLHLLTLMLLTLRVGVEAGPLAGSLGADSSRLPSLESPNPLA